MNEWIGLVAVLAGYTVASLLEMAKRAQEHRHRMAEIAALRRATLPKTEGPHATQKPAATE